MLGTQSAGLVSKSVAPNLFTMITTHQRQSEIKTQATRDGLKAAYDVCVQKTRSNIKRLADEPKAAPWALDGNYFAHKEGFYDIGNWTSSFFAGMALLYIPVFPALDPFGRYRLVIVLGSIIPFALSLIGMQADAGANGAWLYPNRGWGGARVTKGTR